MRGRALSGILNPAIAIWNASGLSTGESFEMRSSSTEGCMCWPLGNRTRSVGLGELSSSLEYLTAGSEIAGEFPLSKFLPRLCPLCSPPSASWSGGRERFWRGIDCGDDEGCRGSGGLFEAIVRERELGWFQLSSSGLLNVFTVVSVELYINVCATQASGATISLSIEAHGDTIRM